MRARRMVWRLLWLLAAALIFVVLAGCGVGETQRPLEPPPPVASATLIVEVATPRPAIPTATLAPAEETPAPESGSGQVGLKTVKLQVSGFT